MTEEQKYELIEHYLAETLSQSAREDFERQLQTDASLQEALHLHQQVATTFKGEKVHQFRAALKEVDQHWQAPTSTIAPKAKVFNLRSIMAIAATVLLVVFAYQIFMPSTSNSQTDLFAANFESYKMVLNQRSADQRDELNGDLVQTAVAAYEQKDFAQAALQFKQLQSESPQIVAFQFYHAIAELALKNTAVAIPLLENIRQQPPHLFIEQSQWYLALAYLQQGEKEKARTALRAIKAKEYQYTKAQKLLKTL
ncbi:MAG: tol-pal system YbgF family protein [Saprospiraceae bacterium]